MVEETGRRYLRLRLSKRQNLRHSRLLSLNSPALREIPAPIVPPMLNDLGSSAAILAHDIPDPRQSHRLAGTVVHLAGGFPID